MSDLNGTFISSECSKREQTLLNINKDVKRDEDSKREQTQVNVKKNVNCESIINQKAASVLLKQPLQKNEPSDADDDLWGTFISS